MHLLLEFKELKYILGYKTEKSNPIGMTNNDNIDKLKSALHTASVELNPLFENGVKTKPYYFGIYKTVYKPGFQASEKLYSKRLQHLVNYLENVKVSNPRAQQYIDKIISYHKAFNSTVDFN